MSCSAFPVLLASTPEESERRQLEWAKMQIELAQLSTKGEQFTVETGDHSTIFTLEENAEFIAGHVRRMLQQISNR